MAIKGLIFDADGPIILSTAIDIGNFQRAAEMNQLQRPTSSYLKRIWGRDLETEILPALKRQMAWTEKQAQDVFRTYQRLSDEAIYPRLNGITQVLESLRCSCRLGLISGRDPSSLERRLNEAGVCISVFDHVELMKKDKCHKPDPEVFSGFWKAGFDPTSAAYVGDSVDYDYRAAVANEPGLPFIAVSSGLSDSSDFRHAGIDFRFIIKKATEIPSLMKML